LKPRNWLAWLFGAFCLLALAIGYLGRPEDEYSFLRRFNPKESIVFDGVNLPSLSMISPGRIFRRFDFTCDPRLVRSSFPVPVGPLLHVFTAANEIPPSFTLPSGLSGELWGYEPIFDNNGHPLFEPEKGEITCVVAIDETDRPSWLARTWKSIRNRLGL
jgi:hypothetical protein